MTNPTYPDAIVKDGVITDLLTGVELPSYEGLVLADCAGRFAVLFTQFTQGERSWVFVQWGSTLSTVEINSFIKENK